MNDLLRDVIGWAERQDVILASLLDVWDNVPAEIREKMPLKVEVDTVTKRGVVVCRFRWVERDVPSVEWIRSVSTLREMVKMIERLEAYGEVHG